MMRWESHTQPQYVWLGDEWYNLRTRDSYVALESGWKHKFHHFFIEYDLSTKIFGL